MLMPSFEKFKDEAAIIGKLLAGYTDLEIGMLNCVQVATGDFDTSLKVLFRTRGETQRIQVADAMGRHVYAGFKLKTEFEMAIGAVKICLSIRNQYAHCTFWDDYSGQLAFANLEDIALLNSRQKGLENLPTLHVDVPLLQKQAAYFEHADAWLSYVNFEGRLRSGKTKTQPFKKPAQLQPPPRHT